jgi:hypothetical protein
MTFFYFGQHFSDLRRNLGPLEKKSHQDLESQSAAENHREIICHLEYFF